MNKALVVIALGVVAFVGMAAFLSTRKQDNSNPTPTASSVASVAPVVREEQATTTPSAVPNTALAYPIGDFKNRITKKFFGTYVTPNNSPVQPEKFTGYHTGVDVEYTDIDTDVPVYAISDGTVLLARWASGYGGVIAIQHKINGQPVIAIYGHVNPEQLPKVGQKVVKGQKIGILGKGYSHETDGERKHLHFGLVKGVKFTLLGYVPNKSQLSAWIDPMTVF
ncbi:MAG: M23 family metallopeptidase [Candidatus Andersenbacteria bacterium]|nr:M23 family metallopeptidase [Candidatus Andersenbacteria bacterium]